MSDIGLGKLIVTPQGRDAVHVAVCPVIAAQMLQPGQHVGFCKGSTEKVTHITEHTVGIIDPFLRQYVEPGNMCWLFLYPGSITSLRHEWTHPAFGVAQTENTSSEPDQIEKSKDWLKAYVEKTCPYDSEQFDKGYSDFLNRENRNEVFFHGTDLHGLHELDDADELREHLETVLGHRIDWGQFSFSCSC